MSERVLTMFAWACEDMPIADQLAWWELVGELSRDEYAQLEQRWEASA